MKTYSKLYVGLLFLIGAVLKAQGVVPPPPTEETGGPGAHPDSPVDMYVLLLAAIAIMFIIYFVKKYNRKVA